MIFYCCKHCLVAAMHHLYEILDLTASQNPEYLHLNVNMCEKYKHLHFFDVRFNGKRYVSTYLPPVTVPVTCRHVNREGSQIQIFLMHQNNTVACKDLFSCALQI